MSAISSASSWADACLAARLLAVDPVGIGGVWLRARVGPPRERWLDLLRAEMPPDSPTVRVPNGIGDDRLLGGLDLTATLGSGRPIAERGLLAAADGGIVLLAMAERCKPATAARVAATLDSAEVAAERDGFALRHPTRIAVVALDEGIEADERPPASLTDRLALHIDLGPVTARDAIVPPEWPGLAAARACLPQVHVPDTCLEAICGAALAFGIDSTRAPLQAVRVAQAAAALDGRSDVSTEDVVLAATLVLAPRATRLPASDAGEPADAVGADGAEAPPLPVDDQAGEDDRPNPPDRPPTMDDVVQAAVAAAIPPDLLAGLRFGSASRSGRTGGAGSGAAARDRRRGRPAGTVRGEPTRGARLNVVETLRAAAPWQALRRPPESDRLAIRRDDLRITRFKRRVETTTVFVVDASGSSAFHRLAEAKGAVELLLAECYIRRDRVALMAFRGTAAELILPPTRSLTRAKRGLAALPGGGGTPLASAIDAAGELAASITRQGGSAVLVFMTDGRANIARDGTAAREAARQDTRAAARGLRHSGATALFIDISPRPNDVAAEIAREMGAGYLPLPAADAATLSGLVRREVAGAAGRAGR